MYWVTIAGLVICISSIPIGYIRGEVPRKPVLSDMVMAAGWVTLVVSYYS